MILSQLGDGLAGVCMRDGEIILIKDEEDDSFVNMTACLGENHRPNLWRSRRLQADECQAVFLMSDGISGGIKRARKAGFWKCFIPIYLDFRQFKDQGKLGDG